MSRLRQLFGRQQPADNALPSAQTSAEDLEAEKTRPKRWGLGILNDRETDEVPGSILLLSKVSDHNEPLGLRHATARTSASSLPSPYPPPMSRSHSAHSVRTIKKKTPDGKIILEPQPEETPNDPLNWPAWRRDMALLSLGFYCMLGGGMTPILAAGFQDVADTYDVSVPRVALTTGLFMMGLGVGSVIASPTAILYGKRPVYLVAALLFVVSAVWCAVSPNYTSLLVARIFQGIAVSPVECLPSATIAEIFFLHERAYRLGIYTLLLLGGKNLIPLVSAAIIQSLEWRWVFWIVAIVVGFCSILLFLFVPETFWDRTPRPRKMLRKAESMQNSFINVGKYFRGEKHHAKDGRANIDEDTGRQSPPLQTPGGTKHAHFAPPTAPLEKVETSEKEVGPPATDGPGDRKPDFSLPQATRWNSPPAWGVESGIDNPDSGDAPPLPDLRNLNSPYYLEKVDKDEDYFNLGGAVASSPQEPEKQAEGAKPTSPVIPYSPPRSTFRIPKKAATKKTDAPPEEKAVPISPEAHEEPTSPGMLTPGPTSPGAMSPGLASPPPESEHGHIDPTTSEYTSYYRTAPPKSFVQTLKPFNKRLRQDSWFRVALRPFILFAYPAVLWSSVVYSLSIGWLIVLSESVSTIYRNRDSYNFTSLQVGLVYISPFIGGVLGTAVAGKVSDVIVRFMSRRNDGIYEPEFRLVMAIPVAISTCIGLMGFGWSAEERDAWIVPTVFFGIISFGCSLGSTTAITFCVDSYRQYAGEALVTLNFSKNIFHGLIFSLFFTHWLESDGPKDVFLIVGGIQIAFLTATVPMYIFGKRARMWTVRKNLMEKF
ncbi:hypothetical protein K402DRAFT_406541 [Aulographum hederae CBS 113979]|uniref:Major facilitator superfamily (MFS) profile domain-containing protein n=1 Tax=Aulographum hederae CBS 113979 TaxID=1176131 RepID=A0A6G1GS59_9PEZI|nr:hypothetical protein K402DRAFT_406541 [Aulographum hederae CBS 113979]